MNTLPQQIRQKLKSNIQKIETLNSSELLEYSKTLQRKKDEIGIEVCDYLFEAIDARRDTFNIAQKSVECRDSEMVSKFIKGRR